MTDDVRIRLGDLVDGAVIAQFNAAMAEETEGQALDPEVAAAGVEGLMGRPDRGFYVVAEHGDEVVASLMVTSEWSDWRAANFWWIQSVYVRPAYRRRGIYRRLYAWVRELAREEPRVCGLRLYVVRQNEIAQRTYAALGMRETAYRLWEDLLP
jgi:GNAT superfamily N-acetyltransferase